MKLKLYTLFFLFIYTSIYAQDVSLFKQFGGHIDFTIVGNTLNLEENGLLSSCQILTQSSANLNLDESDEIIAAYLYWAGSGEGDFTVKLNEVDIIAERTFSDTLESVNLPFFSAFYDVTEQIVDTGNSDYTISDFDLSDIIPLYCPNGTNFGGWAILVVYQNDALPLNQVNIYDGLQHVPDAINIELNHIDVIDNEDAKIGFIAWEGDAALSVNESLFINGNLIGNPPLNPNNNAFNGTDSFTNTSSVYNMDIDYYNVQDNINIGDTNATIQLTSGQDFVMINTIITKLNSQLPDATITINSNEITNCNDRLASINVSVNNFNSTKELPAGTSVTAYVNEQLVGTTYTANDIPINASEHITLIVEIPESELFQYTLTAIVNELNPVLEIRTDNNTDNVDVDYPLAPVVDQPENLLECNLGFEKAYFDFSHIYDSLLNDAAPNVDFIFYPSEEDYLNDTAPINPAFEYENISSPQTIFIKGINTTTGCFDFTIFQIATYNCPPTIPDGFSPNGDGVNEEFNIAGLYDIFTQFDLQIF